MRQDANASPVRRLAGVRVTVAIRANRVNELVREVRTSREWLDEVIAGSARRWKLDRMATVDRNVLRLAVHELLGHDAPPRVVIDEAIEIAKKYGSEDSGGFINGILDDVHRRVREGEIGAA